MTERSPVGRRVPAALTGPAAGVPGASALEAQANLRDWLAVVWRHIRLSTAIAATVMALTAYLALTAVPVYRATSVVRLVDLRRSLAGGLVDGAETDMMLPSA